MQLNFLQSDLGLFAGSSACNSDATVVDPGDVRGLLGSGQIGGEIGGGGGG